MNAVQSTGETPKKEMIFIDQQSINEQNRAVNNTLPFIAAIFESYNAIPGVKQLDTEDLQLIFTDFNTFIENCKQYWYDQNFAASHKSMGITPAKGFKLVDDQLPDFSGIASAFTAYANVVNQRDNWNKYSNPAAFAIQDNKVVINQNYVELFTERAKVYLENETEFKVRGTVDALILNIKTLKEVLPENVFTFEAFGSYPKVMDFNQLHELFDVVYPRFEGEVLQFNHKIAFYRKLKQHLRNTGQL